MSGGARAVMEKPIESILCNPENPATPPKHGDRRVVKNGSVWRYEEYVGPDGWSTLAEYGFKRMHDFLWGAHRMHSEQAAECARMAAECERLARQLMDESEAAP